MNKITYQQLNQLKDLSEKHGNIQYALTDLYNEVTGIEEIGGYLSKDDSKTWTRWTICIRDEKEMVIELTDLALYGDNDDGDIVPFDEITDILNNLESYIVEVKMIIPTAQYESMRPLIYALQFTNEEYIGKLLDFDKSINDDDINYAIQQGNVLGKFKLVSVLERLILNRNINEHDEIGMSL